MMDFDRFVDEHLRLEHPEVWAEVERLQAENEEFKRIRDLLVKAVVRATGADEEAVLDAPLTCAIRHAREVERLQANETKLVETAKNRLREVARLREGRERDAAKVAILEAEVERLRAENTEATASVETDYQEIRRLHDEVERLRALVVSIEGPNGTVTHTLSDLAKHLLMEGGGHPTVDPHLSGGGGY